MYLKPNRNISLVKGIGGCAVYDFNKQRLYRLNLDAYDLLRQTEKAALDMNEVSQTEWADFYTKCLDYEILCGTLDSLACFTPPETLFDVTRCDYAWLEITNYCNQRCLHCYLGTTLNAGEMPYDRVVQAVNGLIQNGMNRICLSGGEPLVHRDIKKILQYLLEQKIDISVLSNGTSLTMELIEILKHPRIYLKIPLLGWERTHDDMAGRPGLFAKCCANLRALKRVGVRFEIGTTVTGSNVQDLERIEAFARELGVKYSKSPVHKIGYANDNWEQLGSDYPAILQSAKSGSSVFETEVEETNSATTGEYIEWGKKDINCSNCAADKLAVDYLGNVYPCLLLRTPTFRMGNLFTDGLRPLLEQKSHGKDNVSKQLAYTDMPLCGQCEVRYLCKGGGCRAVSHLLFRNIKKTSPYWDACYYRDSSDGRKQL